MKNCAALPENYEELFSMDLTRDKKLFRLVNCLALSIGTVMFFLPSIPIKTLFDMSAGLGAYALRFAAMAGSLFAYIVLHELVHGVCMKFFSGIKPHYGFSTGFAYAGSEAYFNKKSYITIALAPVLLWGIVLAVLCRHVPETWFWVFYTVQITNISGAAGDFYVTWRFSKFPSDILVRDTGVAMTVFASKQ